ncbi:hypothetical protein CMUS01_00467 [Colletotrichum musicola]|uniref:Uncharacterized protein n=1 Tax=Colletotrichum musicola TaxID=2175873 RepID=A0A8H6NYY3_9PEZI|nr:hypothetical protein CMUS01_00467 [Colletotrichum musicola]
MRRFSHEVAFNGYGELSPEQHLATPTPSCLLSLYRLAPRPDEKQQHWRITKPKETIRSFKGNLRSSTLQRQGCLAGRHTTPFISPAFDYPTLPGFIPNSKTDDAGFLLLSLAVISARRAGREAWHTETELPTSSPGRNTCPFCSR